MIYCSGFFTLDNQVNDAFLWFFGFSRGIYFFKFLKIFFSILLEIGCINSWTKFPKYTCFAF